LCIDPANIGFGPRNQQNQQTITFTMPARNIIVYIKTDPLYLLTVLLNERQQIEEKEKKELNNNYTERPITNVILREYAHPEKNITLYPYKQQVKAHAVFDIYAQFTDIYQHLDKLNLHSQEPTLHIEEAGEFSGGLGPDQYPLPDEIQTKINEQKEGYKEYYQHIRFKMPTNSLTLDLKWEERLFRIDYDIMQEFFLSTSIKDTNKLIDRHEPEDEYQTLMRQSTFPHAAYPVVCNGDGTLDQHPLYPNNAWPLQPVSGIALPQYMIDTGAYIDHELFTRQNTVEIIATLKPYFDLVWNGSYYQDDFQEKIKFTSHPNNIFTENLPNNNKLKVIYQRPRIYIQFPMTKIGKKISLDVKTFIGEWAEITNYIHDTITLDAGKYRFRIKAGSGAYGAKHWNSDPWTDGQNGAETEFEVMMNEPFTIDYYVGQAGTDRHGGSGISDGGGGGGGSSILVFNVKIPGGPWAGYEAIYCLGGDGGPPYPWRDQDGGRGGEGGGQYENELEPNHKDTSNGDGNYGKDGDSGVGGAGGMGWALDIVKPQRERGTLVRITDRSLRKGNPISPRSGVFKFEKIPV
jgi:hypothetical protein